MKKCVALLLTLVMLLSLMACQKTAGTTDPTQASEQPASANPEDAASAAGTQTEISFITWRAEDSDTLKEMIAAFEKENPDIKVNLEITSTDETEYYTVLKSRLISGEGADVMNVHVGSRLNDLVNAGYMLELDGTGLADTLEPSFLDSGSYNGKLYGLLQTYNSFALYYNADLFDELGITVPTDYTSLLEAVQKSKDAGYMPVAAGLADGWTNALVYGPLFANYGKTDSNIAHKLETGEAKITDEPYVSIYGDFQQMVDDEIFQDNAAGTGYDASISLFASGKATMLVNGTWSIGSIKAMNEDIRIGLARFPAIHTDSCGVISPSQLLCINAKGKNIEASKRFAAFMLSAESETMYCNGTSQASTVVGTQVDVPELDQVQQLISGESALYLTVKMENPKVESILTSCAGRLLNHEDLTTVLEEAQQEIDSLIAE